MSNPSAPALASLPPLPQPPHPPVAKVVTLPQGAAQRVAAAPVVADMAQSTPLAGAAQTMTGPAPLPMPQPVIYNYPQAAQGYYPPPMMMPPQLMMPGLPASVALNPYLAAAMGHAPKAPEAKPEAPEKKGFFQHLYRLIQPENFNWAGNVGAGVVLGPLLHTLLAFSREGNADNVGTQYKRFVGADGNTYRQYLLPATKLEAVAAQASKAVSTAKAPTVINNFGDIVKAAGNLLTGTSQIVNTSFDFVKDAATGNMATGSSEMRAHVIMREGPAKGGWFNSAPSLTEVARFDWDKNIVEHLDDAGNVVKEAYFGASGPAFTVFEAGKATFKNIYTAAEQGIIGGQLRLKEVLKMENGTRPVSVKTYNVLEAAGEKLIQEVTELKPGSRFGKWMNSEVAENVAHVPGVLIDSVSEWLGKLPANAATVIERKPVWETLRKVINPHQLALAAFIGGLVTAGLAIVQQPHHTVVRLGE